MDLALFKKIIKEKIPLSTVDLPFEILSPEGRKVLDFIRKHVAEFGAYPELSTVEHQAEVKFEGLLDQEPVEFYLKQLRQRAKLSRIGHFLKSSRASLDKDGNPDKVISVMREVLKDIEFEGKNKPWDICRKPDRELVWDEYQRLKSLDGKCLGIETPWPFINKATQGLTPGHFTSIISRSETGKCIEENSLVPDANTGILRTIKEIVESKNASVYTLSENFVRSVTPSSFIDSGKKPCYEVCLASGRKIIIPKDDPLLTVDGWVPLERLKVRSRIAVPSMIPEPINPKSIPDEDIDVLALMLSDGCCTHPGKMSFTNEDPQIVKIMENALEKKGLSLRATNMRTKSGREVQWRIPTTGQLKSEPRGESIFAPWLEKYGLLYKKSKEKIIPNEIFQLPNEKLKRFIGLFWSCDGCIDKRGSIELGLASEIMVSQMQYLLLRFGISSRVTKRKTGYRKGENNFDSWRLYVYDSEKFIDNIPSFNSLRVINKEKIHSRNIYKLYSVAITPKLREDLIKSIESLPIYPKMKAMGLTGPLLVKTVFNPLGSCNVRKVKAFFEFFDIKGYDWILNPDVRWEQIKSITPVGLKHVYDLSIKDTHNFVANNIFIHNSWITLKMAACAHQQGKKVLFVSPEMTSDAVRFRLAAIYNHLPYTMFRGGVLVTEDEQKFRNFIDSDIFNSLIIADTPVIGSSEEVAQMVLDRRPDLVIVDSYFLLSMNRRFSSTNEMREALTIELYTQCKRFKVPYIITTHFTAKVTKEKKGEAEDVAYTKQAIRLADLALGLQRDEDHKANKSMLMRFLKHREGIHADVLINFDLYNMNFDQISVDSPLGEDLTPEAASAAASAAAEGAGEEPDDPGLYPPTS